MKIQKIGLDKQPQDTRRIRMLKKGAERSKLIGRKVA